MRKIAIVAAAIAAVMAFVGVSSASALSFSPQNSSLPVSNSSGSVRVQTEHGAISSCYSESSGRLGKASGTVMSLTQGPAGQCPFNPYGSGYLKTFGQWSLTATSTSAVTLKADTVPSGGTVMTLTLNGLVNCTATVKGPISIPGQSWTNGTSSTAALNFTVPMQVTGPGTTCENMWGKSMTISETAVSTFKILP